MSQDLLERKWSNFFRHFDADGNGFIEHEDFVQRGAQVAAAFGYASETAAAQAVTSGFQRVWESLVGNLDADGDGRVSREEFTGGMTVFAGEDRYQDLFQPAIDALLAMGDADGDGQLSRSEWVRLQVGYGTPETDAEYTFGLLDTDGSGYLSHDEISAATRQYFTSTDADAPGNSLYGPLA
ncbi:MULTISPECIES: EF-hand domain-containing protein [unclassified Amycolatopsis]|uniref:EF-hand domain-containing protein n=1 Tax=unclassified Amycolatopsis TaxID=2618356 RepID=UPI002E0DFEDA|nr:MULTISPECIES: EF-hand domain-containing protein [unclassified Amycolatopsis]WSK77061.1 EF-hand domain-containing protein [Amycolatopsis sp. NBC_01286]